ncbi:MAG: tRNA pseudouridine(13) synthase TruD, partial [Candidatus Altarchaeaceae archaeon]
EEKIKKEDFKHEIKSLSFKGDFRKLFLNFENFNYEIINDNTVKFKFDLEKGGFATILLREFCKNKFW